MNGELKACPLCGQSQHDPVRGPYVNATGESFVVVCGKCGASSDYYSRTGTAIEAWNTRPTPAPGALPELPEADGYMRELDGALQYSAGPNMPPNRAGGYATPWAAVFSGLKLRAYAEQCRAGVWLPVSSAPDGDCLEFPIWVAWNNGRVDYVEECACVDYTGCIGWMKVTPPAPPALQSAFADDEGVKNG